MRSKIHKGPDRNAGFCSVARNLIQNKVVGLLLATAFWLIVWEVLAQVVGEELLLPSPRSVIRAFTVLCQKPLFWKTVSISLGRIAIGILSAVLLGVLAGILTGRFALLDTVFSPLLSVVKSTPVASFIFLLLLWLKRDTVPIVITVLMVLPIIWSNIKEGIRQTDGDLLEMANSYRIPFFRQIRRIYIPSVLPYFLSATRSALGLGWKAGIAAEAIVLPAVSIGRQLYTSSNNLQTAEMFAWTLTVILLSVGVDFLVSSLLSRYQKKRKWEKTYD